MLKKIAISLIFFSILFLGSLSFVPGLSIRNIVSVLLFFYLIPNLKKVSFDCCELLYVIYVLVLLVCNILNGNVLEYSFIQNFVSYHLVCLVVISTVPMLITSKDEFLFVTHLFVVIYIINFVLTYLQYNNEALGWDIVRLIYPKGDVGMENFESYEDFSGIAVVQGLTDFVVLNGYFVVTFLPIVSYQFLKNCWQSLMGIFVLLLGIMGLYMIQQRTAFYLGVLYAVFLLFYKFKREFYYVPVILIILALILPNLELSYFDMGRLLIDDYTFSDDRLNLFNLFYAYSLEDNFLLGGEDNRYWLSSLGHNTIFSSLLRGGIFTMFVYTITFIVILFFCMKFFFRSLLNSNIFTLVYSSSCCIFLIVSFTHSLGIQHGAIMFWLLYVLMKHSLTIETKKL